ncbi:Response regulator mcs4 [Psilocybe cubensis]|uniref:Response regulator mcs4 n=2 Tax=Psilocybe cubensis TaxID=181762 RepID=A0ACB8H7E4_PSICU|nr:Response regulator mcs4 [Psilocybe cubensis]KAH9483109.1 Response regulator mcs4 [Psilocybe cubensis]
MAGPHTLPAVRMTAEGEILIQEGVSLELPARSKFGVSYAPSEGHRNTVMEGLQQSRSTLPPITNSSDDEQHDSEAEDVAGNTTSPTWKVAPPPTSPTAQVPMRSFADVPAPGISRALSMPLPSQLSQLQNPHRPGRSDSYKTSSLSRSSQDDQVREVSVELADSIQLVIQTMLQISPPQVLDPAKEQFSACALSVPTSSMSAMFTAMKNINYISANMSALCEQASASTSRPMGQENPPSPIPTITKVDTDNEFDIGEMLQCVGDALSGAAAHAGVDLVLYHGDVGLKHVYVSGNESGISFALSHVVRQVLNTAERGDSIEIGLLVSAVSNSLADHDGPTESPPVDDMLSAAPLESNGPVKVKLRISHKYAPLDTHQDTDRPHDVVTTETRVQPTFSTLLLRRILKQIDGKLTADLPPPEAFTSGRTCDLEMVLNRAPVPAQPIPLQPFDDGVNPEPTLEQLSSFGETLKGRKVKLYASAKGSFAHHLTSYLTAWGMDVTHVSPDGQVDGLTDATPSGQEESLLTSQSPLLPTYAGDTIPNLQIKPDTSAPVPATPNFIFIDDDIDILKERLQALRFENQPTMVNNSRKRPSLSSNHRPKSSPAMARLATFQSNFMRSPPVVIMHFTSLSNYKLVRDVMQSIMHSYAVTSTPLPEVMIIPKPAGPRRFLTALHTAVTKPIVDPLFMPIATSPMSPGTPNASGSFFSPALSEHSNIGPNPDSNPSSQAQSPLVKNLSRPAGSARNNSDRSARSSDSVGNGPSILPPSPLALPDNVEYFSVAAQKLGTSPSSGLVIQSPDGQTAGIYFHPRSKSGSKHPVTHSMERDKGQLVVPGPRRVSVSRVSSDGKKDDNVSFSSLHEAHQLAGQEEAKPVASSSTMDPSPNRSTEDQREQPSFAASILSPVPRKASDEIRKLASAGSAPTEGTPSIRRTAKRSETKDGTPVAGAKQKGKVMGSDNVVPPISVLIVDDNPINQTILSTFMRRKRIKYDLASNGQEAVQKWRTGGFHLILMDIQMPIMDGIQATKEIRRLEKLNAASGYPPLSPTMTDEGNTSISSGASSTSETRSFNSPYRSSVIIVALTASSLQTDRVAALAAGCNDFLTKPVSLLWLNNKIIEWGSIKALQMWADLRPDGVRSVSSGLEAQARNVAEKLHVPVKERPSPSSSSTRRSTSALEDNAAALALASSSGTSHNLSNVPPSPLSSSFMVPDRPRSRSSNISTSGQNSRSTSFDTARSSFETRTSIEMDQDSTPKPSTPETKTKYRESGMQQKRSTPPINLEHTDDSLQTCSPSTSTASKAIKAEENGFSKPVDADEQSTSPNASVASNDSNGFYS